MARNRVKTSSHVTHFVLFLVLVINPFNSLLLNNIALFIHFTLHAVYRTRKEHTAQSHIHLYKIKSHKIKIKNSLALIFNKITLTKLNKTER